MEEENRIKKVKNIVKAYAKALEATKIKYEIETIFNDIRYCVLEIHSTLEWIIDDIILKRYIAQESSYRQHRIKTDILSKIDFSRKIVILKELTEQTECNVNIGNLVFFNNLRNALVHNFPKNHSFFKYKGSHIVDDIKIKDVFSDILKVLNELGEAEKQIKPIEDYSSIFEALSKRLIK